MKPIENMTLEELAEAAKEHLDLYIADNKADLTAVNTAQTCLAEILHRIRERSAFLLMGSKNERK